MKYSILLMGKNNSIIEDFFTHMRDEFECLSTSNRYEDILNHLKYYAPDAFVYCLNQENEENIKQVLSVKGKLRAANIPIVIIGSDDDCNMFIRYAANTAKLVLTKPITINAISGQLKQFLDEQKELEEERRRAEEERRLEEMRRIEEEQRLEEEQRRKGEREGKKRGDEKKHVLVVDDDPLMLKMIKEHLHDEYDVATAISGKVALKFLETKTTDLILLDYEMPLENGPAVLEKLHNNVATRSIPVIFLTGITEKRKIQKALVLKPQGYLLKPIDHEKLMRAIKRWIG